MAEFTDVKLLVSKGWKPLNMNPTYKEFLDRMHKTPEDTTCRDNGFVIGDGELDRIHTEKLVFYVSGEK